jgi:asparagine synthase (glutamine-hydrolysing)
VALMSQVTDKVSTFCVSFAEKEFSEAAYARTVSKRFNTDHHEIELSPQTFLGMLPEALDRMDHPSGDGPNTYVVSKLTKDAGITMALSGLGGDELFGGYSVFRQGLRLDRLRGIERIPHAVRSLAARSLAGPLGTVATRKIAEVIGKSSISALAAYPLYRQVWFDDQVCRLLRGARISGNSVEELMGELASSERFSELPRLSQISVAEIVTYMQNVLLRDTDQMSMAHALEVRVPFLDHELVEFVLGIDDSAKYPHTSKQLLVETLGDLLPPEIVHRPKMGFALPFADWMRGDLRAFCDARLLRLAERPQFDGSTVLTYWRAFLDGKRSVGWSRIWVLVTLEHWLDRNGLH